VRLTPLLHRGAACLIIAALGACTDDSGPDSAPESAAGTAPVEAVTAPPDAGGPTAADEPNPETRDQRRERMVEASTPELPAWQPELATAEARSTQEILERAEQSFEAGRIHSGEDNALGLYLSLLEREPELAAAEEGVARVIERLREAVEQSTTGGEFDRAAVDLAVLLRLRPQDAEVQQLQARLERARLVALLLEDAERLAARGRIVDPPDDNAAGVYAEVLALEPDQAEALAGLARLESALVAQATAAAEAGDYASSDRLLADAARVRPGSGQVQDASTQIVELRQGRAGELLEQAHAEVAAGRVERASQLLAQLESVSAQSQGIEELRSKIDLARLYGAFAPGQAIREALAGGGEAPELVVIPVGRYAMGSPGNEVDRKKNEGPRHDVTFARGFALGRTEVTVAEFGRFIEATGYETSAKRSGRSTIYDERTGSMAERKGIDWRRDHGGRRAEPDLPVVHVSWSDAKAYADWLSRETGASYRLPSEAEFEYALRAGTTTRYPWGDGNPGQVVGNVTGEKDRSATQRGWSNAFPDYGDGFWGAAPVRAYRANAFGLHDTEGNVSEWVEDCWHDSYARAPNDGTAWVNPGCNRRVIRGASWASAPDQARAAFRISAAPDASNARVGFRVARDL
jgi:formylglycine-generating enzyme required for sulfatase activity